MSHRINISIPDEHFDWLDNKIRTKRGWDSVQGAIRSIIEDAFRLDKKISTGKAEEPESLKMMGVVKEKSAIQMS